MDNATSKPFGRSLSDFKSLSPAEQKLLKACRIGEVALISEQRPELKNENNIVRAYFLRFLALGGDEQAPVHEKGVSLYGAWIEGKLDLEGASLPHSLFLGNCHFSIACLFGHCRVYGFLSFDGCQMDGLNASYIVCSGSILLTGCFTIIGTVNLTGAQIGGDLVCDNGKFDARGGDALSCDGAVIKGNVFLRNGFTAIGTVRLVGVQIDGSLECTNAVFNNKEKHILSLGCDRAVIKGGVFLNGNFVAAGTVSLQGAQIGGDLECCGATFNGANDYALVAEGMTVAGAFYFCELRSVTGNVSLAAASVGSLIDDVTSWSEELHLDGFVYDRLAGNIPTDAKTRLAWLDKQISTHAGLAGDGKDFKPQPWRQLQKVLHEMGHVEDARQVAIAFEDRLYEANCKPPSQPHRLKIASLASSPFLVRIGNESSSFTAFNNVAGGRHESGGVLSSARNQP